MWTSSHDSNPNTCLDVGPDGHVYHGSDSNERIFKTNQSDGSEMEAYYPSSSHTHVLAVDKDRWLYTFNTRFGEAVMHVFSDTGNLAVNESPIHDAGRCTGVAVLPSAIEIVTTHVNVDGESDGGCVRKSTWDNNEIWRQTFEPGEEYNCVAIDIAGFIYVGSVSDQGQNRLRKISPEGNLIYTRDESVPVAAIAVEPGPTGAFSDHY